MLLYVISLLQVEKILCALLAMFVPASPRTNNYSFSFFLHKTILAFLLLHGRDLHLHHKDLKEDSKDSEGLKADIAFIYTALAGDFHKFELDLTFVTRNFIG